jgi:hypothetical protein
VVGTDRSTGAHQVAAVLQSRHDLALRRVVMPSVVVKKSCAPPKDDFLFEVAPAVKNPKSNRLCFGVAALPKKERDALILLRVQDETALPGNADNYKAAAEKEMAPLRPFRTSRDHDDCCDPPRGLHRVRGVGADRVLALHKRLG